MVASNQKIFYKFSEFDFFKNYEKFKVQMIFTGAVVGLFTVFYVINYLVTKEGFFFVAPQNPILGRNMPRKAIYNGKPITFDFDSVGSGMCTEESCNNYGMIKGCPNGRFYGTENTDDNIL
jgi:hypothetical protein